RAESAFLLLPIVFFLVYFSFFSKIRLGIRYLLPITPLLIVWVSRIAAPGLKKRPALQTLGLVIFSLWYVIGTLQVAPHYLAYFNELAGGPGNGYKCLVDSNLDWGQDLRGLKEYMDAHGIDKIKLSYFGTGEPDYYGIHYEYLPSSMTIRGL